LWLQATSQAHRCPPNRGKSVLIVRGGEVNCLRVDDINLRGQSILVRSGVGWLRSLLQEAVAAGGALRPSPAAMAHLGHLAAAAAVMASQRRAGSPGVLPEPAVELAEWVGMALAGSHASPLYTAFNDAFHDGIYGMEPPSVAEVLELAGGVQAI